MLLKYLNIFFLYINLKKKYIYIYIYIFFFFIYIKKKIAGLLNAFKIY